MLEMFELTKIDFEALLIFSGICSRSDFWRQVIADLYTSVVKRLAVIFSLNFWQF